MDVFFKILKDWYQWIIAIPIIGALIIGWQRGLAKTGAKKIKGIFKLLWNADKMQLAQSEDAKFCPQPGCGKQMKLIDARRFDHWFYKCECMDHSLRYPAPNRNR